MRRVGVLLMGVLAGSACAGEIEAAGRAPAGTLLPIPDKPEVEQFAMAPAAWRDYLISARAAERIEDPLRRCLAYPDIPGNRWPKGHAQAHCASHQVEVLSLGEIDAYLQAGDAAGLDARMVVYLEKHFSGPDAGEDIHDALEHFRERSQSREDADRISSRWLELAPGSAYAHVARAHYLNRAAWKARGGALAAQTPESNMRRMRELADEAIPFYRKAVVIEPRLMPAYVGLLDTATLASRSDVERQAVALSMEQDPACVPMAIKRMQAAEPRWGGSYEDMLAISAELARHAETRPLLGLVLGAPYGHKGWLMLNKKEYSREGADILDLAVRTGSNDTHLHDAAEMWNNVPQSEGGPDVWKMIAMLLQESRFRPLNWWGSQALAWGLMLQEPEWAMRHAMRIVETEPDRSVGHFMLGAAYQQVAQYAAAEVHYLISAEDEQYALDSLRNLSEMLLHSGAGVEDPKAAARHAGHYIDRLLDAYPKDGYGWLLRVWQHMVLYDDEVETSVLLSFIEHADRGDPVQAEAVAALEASME